MLAGCTGLALVTAAEAAVQPYVVVPSSTETPPGEHAGDTMDDPAIWVDRDDPSRSLVIGNDKAGALESYDLEGNLVQRIDTSGTFWGNVDLRQDVTVGGYQGDLVTVAHRGVTFLDVDPTSRQLSEVNDDARSPGLGEGACMYRSSVSGKTYGFGITIQGVLSQYEVLDADLDGRLELQVVRSFPVGSEAEACVADDETGALYVSEEDHALWRYSAEPAGGTSRTAVDVVAANGGQLAPDIEGLALVEPAAGGKYLLVSAQNVAAPNASYFAVYRIDGGQDAFVGNFRVGDGADSDDCDRTDGIAATAVPLGPGYPGGLFVCQDNNNDAPGLSGNQGFKYVGLDTVLEAVSSGEPPPPPPPPPPPTAVEAVVSEVRNAHARGLAVPVPTGVRPGDLMLLLASVGDTRTLAPPGSGWVQAGRVEDGSTATTVWRRLADGSDAGSTVRVESATLMKAAVTLAVYRGVDQADPLVSVAGAPETGSSSQHTTPRVSSPVSGAWRLSYWSDRNSATTRWTAPPGETVRASSAGAGGGRVGSLLSDSGAGISGGPSVTTGGLVATADAAASHATSWTLLLRPASSEPPDQPPTAVFASDCDEVTLTCVFDASESSDAEDSLTYAWSFGDGSTGAGAVVEHTYAGPGRWSVGLRVTDTAQQTDDAEQEVVLGTPVVSEIEFVGAAARNAHTRTFQVPVPASTQAGDLLVAIATTGDATTLTGPGAGWTSRVQVSDTQVTQAWTKVAAADDVGGTVRLTSATLVKGVVTLVAYRGADAVDPVAEVAGRAEPARVAVHTTPVVPHDQPGVTRLSYWSDRTSATTGWSAPAAESARSTTAGTGGGRVSSLLTDSGGPVPLDGGGSTGGLDARADAESAAATMLTMLLRPQSG